MENPRNSGRMYLVKSFTVTYCTVVILSSAMVFLDKMAVEAFLGLVAGLAGILGSIQTFYFLRTDRKPGETNGN